MTIAKIRRISFSTPGFFAKNNLQILNESGEIIFVSFQKPIMTRSLFSKKRIGICGGKAVDEKPIGKFCSELGKRLSESGEYILVSGGCKKSKDINKLSVDWYTINGAVQELLNDTDKIKARIETILPDEKDPEIEKFDIGNVIKLYGKSPQARRFAFVSSVDVLVAIEGRKGTTQNIDLALALNIPVLPLPVFGGKASVYWKLYEDQIKKRFKINNDFGQDRPTDTDSELISLAEEVKEYLVGSLQPTCMVIMPFHKDYDPLYDNAIVKALEKNSFLPIRTDRLNATGDIIEMIHSGINNCDCAIAVVSELRPNVMYELGLAHAFQKPVLLLMKKNENQPSLPFDIDNHSVIFYDNIDDKLIGQISNTIQNVRETYLPGRFLTFRN